MGGSLGGRKLEVAKSTRPSSALLRGALASIWLDRLPGARVLDLFAGSGAVSLELLSRGATSAVVVEVDRAAREALSKNVALAPSGQVRLLPMPVERALELLVAESARFELLFVDPPYEMELEAGLLARCAELAPTGAMLAVERRAGRRPPEPPGWRFEGSRRYGEAELHLYERE